MMRTAATAAALLLVLVAGVASSSHAGNVLMQIECGNPPKSQETDHHAEVVDFEKGATEVRGEIILPVDGKVGELWVDGEKLTLEEHEVKRGFLQTAELGRVFFFLSESHPGYFLVVLPEQVDRLEQRRRQSAGTP